MGKLDICFDVWLLGGEFFFKESSAIFEKLGEYLL
jgi:hypothetical protein